MPTDERAHVDEWAHKDRNQNQNIPSTGSRIEDLDIRAVWDRLGLGPLRGDRGRAAWRDGDGYNVALDSGRWFDHARGEGGGILALVEIVLGCDLRGALDWLTANFGIASGNTYSVAEKREFAERRGLLRTIAARLIERRDDYLLDLRTASGILLAAYHLLTREAEARQDIELAAQAETVFTKLDEVTARRDWLRTATTPELAGWFAPLDESVAE
jgi:hypothetical protein